MSNDVFFTGDTHFNHLKCWELFRVIPDVRAWTDGTSITRFASVEEMNETIIAAWNAKVAKSDRVYHLGDFALGKIDAAAVIAKRLKGHIYLIRGNHEQVAMHKKVAGRFEWIKDYHYLKVDGQKVFLLHYPMMSWNCMHYGSWHLHGHPKMSCGSWHLHGHCHGTLPDDPNAKRLDVGVDAWNFAPVSWDEIAQKMATKGFVAVDHHVMEDEGHDELGSTDGNPVEGFRL